MLLSDVSPNRRPLMFLKTLIQVLASVANTIRIAQITPELFIHDRGVLVDIGSDLSACAPGMDISFFVPPIITNNNQWSYY